MATIELLGIIGVSLIALTISSAAWSYTRRYVRRERQQADICRVILERWATQRSLRFEEASMKVQGTIGELDVFVTAAYDQLEPGIPPMVTMSTIAVTPRPILMQIAPSRWALSEWVARKRVKTDEPTFDASLQVWCDPPSDCSDLLTADLRATLIALGPDEFLYDRGVVELRWEEEFLEDDPSSMERLDLAYRALALACRGNGTVSERI
jgi:hypothetical protein